MRIQQPIRWSSWASVLIFLVGGSVLAQTAELKTRSWTDSLSQRSVRARLVSVDEGMVKLKTHDGEIHTIQLARLGKSDQRYIEHRLKDPEIKQQLQSNADRMDQQNPLAMLNPIQRVNQGELAYRDIPWRPMDDLVNDGVEKNDKPIYWLRVLGDLDGLM